MADWLKILFSTLGGLLVGLLVEPLKQWISTWCASRRAEQAIYKELGQIYAMFGPACHIFTDIQMHHVFEESKFDVFPFYFEKFREGCFRIKTWPAILATYNIFNGLRDRAINDPKHAKWAAERIHETIDTKIKAGLLDKQKIEEASAFWLSVVQKHHDIISKLETASRPNNS